MKGDPPRILFVLQHSGHLRKFDAAIRSMAERGHQICVAFPGTSRRASAVAERLDAEYPNVRMRNDAPTESVDPLYRVLARLCRQMQDALRLLSPRYARYSTLRTSVAVRFPVRAVGAAETIGQRAPFLFEAARRALTQVERVIPVGAAVLSFVREERPDALLVSPLVSGPFLVDYVRAAARLGVPSCLPVASWDNLTTKGVLHAPPDRMIVWNHHQRVEAAREMDFPAVRVIVTGAHTFDDFFRRTPSKREDFCRPTGLDPGRRYLLYACSSKRIAPNESAFVERWIQRLRAHGDPRIRDLAVLVRPHFQNARGWSSWRPNVEHVVVSPPEGEDPVTESARTDYFDALYHSVAVVGLNTTALIEAGIVGRPVLTIVPGMFGQESMPHFHHLVDGGLLRIARDFDEHLAQLVDAVVTHRPEDGARPTFLGTFVRPFGLDAPAAPLFATAVESVVDGGSAPLEGTRPPRLTSRIAWQPLAFALALASTVARTAYRSWRRLRNHHEHVGSSDVVGATIRA